MFTRLLMLNGVLAASQINPVAARKGKYDFLPALMFFRTSYVIGVITRILPSFEKTALTAAERKIM